MLDLGSGGGIDVLLSARRVGPTGKAYGLDMTDEMLALARENQRKAGVDNVEFLKGEIEAIPLPDNSVDVIISNCVINLSADKDRVLAEAFRVLKPGGRFAVSDVVVRGEVPAVIRRSVELWIGCVAGALEEDEYRAKLGEAGFEAVDVEPTRIYRTEDAREFLDREGIDAAAIAPSVDGKFMSAFVRARKPRGGVSSPGQLQHSAAASCRRQSARRCSWPRWSVPGSWASAWPAATSPSRCWRTRWPPGAALVALILTFGPISGAHFNPAVTLADASQGGLAWAEVPPYIVAQIAGAFVGVAAAHLHVRAAAVLRLASRPGRIGADLQRVRGHVRTAGGDLGLCAFAPRGGAIRGGRLHHGRLLVHGLHVVRQSGGDAGAVGHRYLRGHPARRRFRLHRRAAPRRRGGHRAVPMAAATPT